MDVENLEYEIFFGNPTNAVSLAESADSLQYEFKKADVIEIRDNHTVSLALKNKAPLNYLGPEYNNLYVPCIPAIGLSIHGFLAQLKPCQSSETDDIMSNGLIKVPTKKGEISAYKSGKRSAVAKWSNGKHYRLKGCGNLDQGFITEPMQADDPKAREIRGCHYYHTAINELSMNEYISDVLKKYGILCANSSKGLWQYRNVEKHGLKHECRLVDKYCAVFETFGEKRVATHLLQGIEVILHQIITNSKEFVKPESLEKLFPASRIDLDPVTKLPTVNPTGWCIPMLEIPEVQTLEEWTRKPIYPVEENEKLVDIKVALKTQDLAGLNIKGAEASDILKTLGKTSKLEPQLIKILNDCSERFGKSADELFSTLADIYSRIGSESGIIKRILQNKEVNWGFFMDHHHLVSHCNAHPNNLVVLAPGSSKFLLGPLDFDLAFLKKNFINIDLEEMPERYGTHDEAQFDNFSNNERYNLELALSGFENMINFSYSGLELAALSSDQNRIYEALKIALRDTLIINYRRAYDNLQSELESIQDVRKSDRVFDIVKIALILTSNTNC